MLVGSQALVSLTHDLTSPHTNTLCSVPPGSEVNLGVRLLQAGGEMSESDFTVSYTACSPGTYYEYTTASTACRPCLPGTFSFASALKCEDCPTGKFAEAGGSDECVECAAGFYATTKQLTCASCTKGSFSAKGAGRCRECEKGEYSPTDNSTACIKCEAGRFTRATNHYNCSDCAISTYTSQSGMSSCSDCPLGQITGVCCVRRGRSTRTRRRRVAAHACLATMLTRRACNSV